MMLVAFRYDEDKLLGKLLAWWQRSDVSHCEVVLSTIADVHECASSSWRDGGVRVKRMQLPAEKWRIYWVPSDDKAAMDWLSENVGSKYDWIGLFGFVFRRIGGQRRRWFCSEACAAMAGISDSWRFDVASLESVCAAAGRRIQ